MTEQLISFDTAKLAKEKGFDIKTKHWYDQIDGLNPRKGASGSMMYENIGYAPTQSLLQKWLRETHDIKLCVSWTDNDEYLFEINHKQEGMSGFESYEEALEDGLIQALQLIK